MRGLIVVLLLLVSSVFFLNYANAEIETFESYNIGDYGGNILDFQGPGSNDIWQITNNGIGGSKGLEFSTTTNSVYDRLGILISTSTSQSICYSMKITDINESYCAGHSFGSDIEYENTSTSDYSTINNYKVLSGNIVIDNTIIVSENDWHIVCINLDYSDYSYEMYLDGNLEQDNVFTDNVRAGLFFFSATTPYTNPTSNCKGYHFIIDNIYYEPLSEEGIPDIVEINQDDFFVTVSSEDFQMYSQKCITDIDCKLKILYPYSYLNDNLNLYETNESGIALSLIATTTVTDDIFYNWKPLLANEQNGTIKYYKAYNIDENTYSNIAQVKWYDENNYADDEYNLDSVCDDISTSTTWYGIDFGYAIECGFRKLSYWAFTPKPSTYLKLDNAKQEIMQEFPFEMFYFAKNIITIASSSATSTWIIPVMWIASSTTIANMTFENTTISTDYPTLWEKFMLAQKIIFYLAALIIIYKLGMKILRLQI